MIARIITAQDFIDDEIVAEKSAAGDYTVIVSPGFEYDGQTLSVLLDGNHRMAAAILDGVEPEIITATACGWDILTILEETGAEAFLAACNPQSDWRYCDNGCAVW